MSFFQSNHIIARALRRIRETAALIWLLNTKFMRDSHKAQRRFKRKIRHKSRAILKARYLYILLVILLGIKFLTIFLYYFNASWFTDADQAPAPQLIQESSSVPSEDTPPAATTLDEISLSPRAENKVEDPLLQTSEDSVIPDHFSGIPPLHTSTPIKSPDLPAEEHSETPMQALRNPKLFTRQSYLNPTIPEFMRTINPQYFIEAAPNQEIQVAILVTNLSLHPDRIKALYSILPSAIGFVLSPYRADLTSLIESLKSEGHPVVMSLPMEDEDPYTDQGYLTLRATMPPHQNQEHLREILVRGKNVDAFFGEGGARLMKARDTLKDVFSTLQQESVSFIAPPDVMMTRVHEAAQETNLNYITATVLNPLPKQISLVEKLAKRTGYAIVIFEDHAQIEEDLYTWMHTLESMGVHIVPITELIHSGNMESDETKDTAV